MAYESNSIFWIEVEKVVPNPFQPRREFDEKKLQELADSIRMYGVLQPLVVTRREVMKENGAFSSEYELIAGERRLRASKLAGLTQVPVLIRTGEESSLMKLELAIIENLQREDLNPVDRALAFKQLADAFGFSHAQVAEKVGRSREYVSNSIRLLLLPETILNALRQGDISDGHARTLLMLNDRPEEQDIVFREILLKKLSVREVERISRKIATEKVRKVHFVDGDAELQSIEREFTETLGTRVQILRTDYGGRMTIDYFSQEDLRKILDMIHRGDPNQSYTKTDNELIGRLTAAVPLTAVAHAAVPAPVPVVVPPPTVPTVPVVEETLPVAVDTVQLQRAEPQPEYVQHDPIPSSETFEALVSEAPHDEDIFTKHDTLHVPETPPEVLDAEIATEPAIDEVEDETLYSLRNFSL